MAVRNTTARAAATRVLSLLQGSVQAAQTVTRFLGTIAAAGMGADTTPPESPMEFPVFEADDEDEDEVDNCFDYETNEFSDIGEDARGAEQRGAVKQVVLGMEEDVTMEIADAGVSGTVEVEHRAVFQETTVVRVVSHPDSDEEQKGEVSDSEQQHNQLLALRAAVDPVTTLALRMSTADASSNFARTDASRDFGVEKDDMSDDADTANADRVDGNSEDVGLDGEGEEQTRSKRSKPDDQQAEDASESTDVCPDEDVVCETPPSEDTPVHRDDDGKSGAFGQQQDEQQQPEPVPTPPPQIAIDGQEKQRTRSEAEAPGAMQLGHSGKRKLELSSPSRGGQAPPAKTVAAPPVQTPKRSKQAASKKRKPSPHLLHRESPRRSSRIKNEPPRFTVRSIPDETVMSHFDRDTVAGTPSPDMTCHFCGTKVAVSRSWGKSHLDVCSAYPASEQLVQKLGVVSEDKPARLSSRAAPTDHARAVKSEVPIGQASAARGEVTLVELMGSSELAAKLKQSIGSPFAGHARIDRFREMIDDDETGLRHLRVQSLLDAVDPSDEPVVQLLPRLPGLLRSTGQQAVALSIAKARALENYPLRFPAPHQVGDQFISLLARELGLGYALKKHRAKVVSCPQDGTVLDWQFHKTETVAFQLRGKAVWNVKKSRMKHPLQSFHPQSWSFDDIASAAKVHRVASMGEGSVGFLAPPGEDDTFDESLSEDVGAGQEEAFPLEPGSVVYVPDGAWFEVESHGTDALWLEVQLASTSREELVFSAWRQLAWGDEQWRMPVRIYPGDRAQAKQLLQDVDARAKSLGFALEGLLTDDLQELIAEGLVVDISTSSDVRSLEVDLTDPRFKLERLKHSKVFCNAVYRVNPVAVLVSADEIPHLAAQEGKQHAVDAAQASSTTMKPHRALKKRPKPKPKQKAAHRAISPTSKHTYVLDEAFGNDKFQSQLHVKFQCSGEQSRMVEWLRCRGSERFDLDAFIQGQSTPQSKIPEKKARELLRFLHFVGYVSQVKSP